MVNIHTSNSCKLKHPHKWSFWNAFNWPINVSIYYKLKQLDKVNVSYVYNVDKILSQFDNFQHLSTFDAWWWIFRRFFFMKVVFIIWIPKKGIKTPTFLRAIFLNNIYMEKNWMSKIEYEKIMSIATRLFSCNLVLLDIF
jgi:hypothetical protein